MIGLAYFSKLLGTLKSKQFQVILLTSAMGATLASASNLSQAVNTDYEEHLEALFKHFHSHPELSFREFKTAERIAKELRSSGFKVTEDVGQTGVVAILENGKGPTVMMRADMDGLPVKEDSGLAYASKAEQKDRHGKLSHVMHACGHDVHITSLVGTARRMAALKDQWSGTLMLIAQPAEEVVGGALSMRKDNIWKRFGKPDYALAFHVSAGIEAGKLVAVEGSPFSGVDTLEIVIHGVGAHGASPHKGKDPIVLGSQIVMALQTVVSRELAPREPGVITVGSFHSGTKSNIISNKAILQLTVRNDSEKTRKTLLAAIERIAKNLGRAAGLPEDMLPEVKSVDDPMPPTVNDLALTRRLKSTWSQKLGENVFFKDYERLGMGAEDFPVFTTEPYIPSVYFFVGGTPKEDIEAEKSGGPAVASHHSPFFKIDPKPSITTGVEATVTALLDLMADGSSRTH